jgi:probable HAF family extracellular repeat protein
MAGRRNPTQAKPCRRARAWLGISLVSLLVAATGASAQTYELVDLGAYVSPEDVNEAREVVGSMGAVAGERSAFVYSFDGMPMALPGTVAWAINDAGRIVGNTETGAFVVDRGTPALEWDDVGAFGVSPSGLVSGNTALENPYRSSPRPLAPALYDGTTWSHLDVARVYPRGRRDGIYADLYVLWDVNDTGIAVGSRERSGLVGSSAVVTDPDFQSLEFLPILNGGRAFAINEQAQIVGATGEYSASGIFEHAFSYAAGTVTDLGTLGGLRSRALDVNDAGQVVGTSSTTPEMSSIPRPDLQHAFLWQGDTGLVDLNGLVDAPDWILTSATSINDAGDIVGMALLEGQPHGFLLLAEGTVVPPPPDNEPPVAVASADVYEGRAPLAVQFDGSSSTDPDGWALTFHWDFGDGTSSTERSPAHVYESPGSYLVVLTVEDQGGLDASAQLEITVRRGKGRGKRAP